MRKKKEYLKNRSHISELVEKLSPNVYPSTETLKNKQSFLDATL